MTTMMMTFSFRVNPRQLLNKTYFFQIHFQETASFVCVRENFLHPRFNTYNFGALFTTQSRILKK